MEASNVLRPNWVEPATAEEFTLHMHASRMDSWEHHCKQRVEFEQRFGYTHAIQPTFFAVGKAWDRFQMAKTGVVDPYEKTEEQRDGYYTQKMADGKDLPEDVVDDLTVAFFREEAEQITDWSQEPADKDGMEKRLRMAAKAWRKVIAPSVEPRQMHTSFQIPIDAGEWSVRGTVDMAASFTADLLRPDMSVQVPEGTIVARDVKTSKSRWAAGAAATKIQPYIYSIGIKNDPERFPGVDPNVFEYEITTKAKTPTLQVERVEITDKHRDSLLSRAAHVRREMTLAFDTNYFPPNRTTFRCSKKMCPHWRQCEALHGSGVRD